MNENQKTSDVLIVGGGASGLLAAIAAAQNGASVTICEKMPEAGLKILASGGERCNITNTLDQSSYIERFGRNGRFMLPALEALSNIRIRELFSTFGIETSCRDGFRVFPSTHKSQTVMDGLLGEIDKLGVSLLVDTSVNRVYKTGDIWSVETSSGAHHGRRIILSTGGLSYPWLGSSGKGYEIAETLGHKILDRFPGGVPLETSEKWPAKCRADTIGKARISVNMKKHKKITNCGDIIFTNYGIAGPAILDISREITPLIDKYGSVPVNLNLRPKMTQQIWQDIFADWKKRSLHLDSTESLLTKYIPTSICIEICKMVSIDHSKALSTISAQKVQDLIQILTSTPLTITGSKGYKLAFITRGGVKISEIESKTLESKIVGGLHICGELLDIDGPCGGFNLQWAFASGFLAGYSASLSLR